MSNSGPSAELLHAGPAGHGGALGMLILHVIVVGGLCQLPKSHSSTHWLFFGVKR